MTSGYELMVKVKSRGHVVLREIKEILIDAYRDLKPKVLVRLKGLQRLAKKTARALKGRQGF